MDFSFRIDYVKYGQAYLEVGYSLRIGDTKPCISYEYVLSQLTPKRNIVIWRYIK